MPFSLRKHELNVMNQKYFVFIMFYSCLRKETVFKKETYAVKQKR